MSAIQKALEALENALNRTGVFNPPELDCMTEAIQALQSLEGEAVEFTCHGRSAPAYSCNKPGDMSGTYYTTPQPPAVPDAIAEFIAKKKSEIEQYADKYCRLEPDTNAAVWDSEYHQQHEEDISEFIAELESVIAAAQQGGAHG